MRTSLRDWLCNLWELPLILPLALMLVLAGCDDDEEILDVETGDGGVEVERDPDSGEVDVETHD